jgi:ribosomal protein L35AE/L33A
LLIAPSTATLTIVDDDFGPGQIGFASSSYAATENGGNAVITLVRTNGSSGVVGVTFKTSDFTAVAGFDYTAVNTAVTFSDGETTKSVLVPVLDDTFVEGNEIFHVTLTNATGGASITEPATVPVTILDNDMGLSFSSPFYSVSEAGPSVTLTVLRLGGSNGVATVRYDTTNLTATAGLDFGGVTNGLLTFNHGEVIKTFTIPILKTRWSRVTSRLG